MSKHRQHYHPKPHSQLVKPVEALPLAWAAVLTTAIVSAIFLIL